MESHLRIQLGIPSSDKLVGGVRGREGSDGAAAKNEGEGRIQLELKKLPGQGGAGWKELEGSDRGWNWRDPRRSDQGEELIRWRFAWCVSTWNCVVVYMFDFLIQNIQENLQLLDPSGTSTPMMVWKELQAVWLQCISSILLSNSHPFSAPPQKKEQKPYQIQQNPTNTMEVISFYSSREWAHTVTFT